MHIKGFLWAFTFVLVALLFYQIFVSLKAFASKPTFSNYEFLDQKDANLPDTTFCVPSENFVSYPLSICTRYFKISIHEIDFLTRFFNLIFCLFGT
jgi:hypothetical protein